MGNLKRLRFRYKMDSETLVGIKAPCFPVVDETTGVARAVRKIEWPTFTEAPAYIQMHPDTVLWNKTRSELEKEFRQWKPRKV